MAKEVLGFIKLQIPAGGANPSPPVGPALGQRGLNIMDFCKAFNDKTKELEKGAPIMFIRWLHSFFQNRQARVKFCGTESSSRVMRQGLPQGSVLSPIPFLFYKQPVRNSP